jgi:hypothetical protein
MPIAGGRSVGETRKFDLKSCPPDGYITIRRLVYGDKMLRRNLLGKTTVHGSGGSGKKDFVAEMQLINDQVTMLEFSKCIVDHNLTLLARPGDASSEVAVDFSNPMHIKLLDGNVGEEIDDIITRFNDFEGDDDTGKLHQQSEISSSPIDQ